MEVINGLQSLDFAIFDDLQHELDLLEYDGPILSSFSSKEANNKYIYLKYIVDLGADFSRWLCFPIAENTYINLITGKISLNKVIISKSFFAYQIEDVYQDKIKYHLLQKSLLPDFWLPEGDFFLKKEHYEGKLQYLNAAIDHSWSIDRIKFLVHKLSQIHNYISYMVNPIDGVISSEAGSGFKGAKIYTDILSQLNKNGFSTPKMKSIEYASPGVIKISGERDILLKSYGAIQEYLKMSEEIDATYKDLYSLFLKIEDRDKKENVAKEFNINKKFSDGFDKLSSMLPYHDNKSSNLSKKDDVEKLLMAFSYYRRIRDVVDIIDTDALDIFM